MEGHASTVSLPSMALLTMRTGSNFRSAPYEARDIYGIHVSTWNSIEH
jgi:hypothetical protein